MAEIRVKISDEIMKKLSQKLGLKTSTEIAREALTLLNWAVDETDNDRVILSSKKDGKDIHRLAMPSLSLARAGCSQARVG